MPELAEAASRTADRALLESALEWLSERTRVISSEWATGIEARVRALLSEGEVAESLYRESIAHLSGTRVRLELARTHLLYGEWLRRERRRLDARKHLRTALEAFTSMGAEAFARRAERELLATGERARKRTVDTLDQLTPQETQIARLAAKGHTNREIAAQLFITRAPSSTTYARRSASSTSSHAHSLKTDCRSPAAGACVAVAAELRTTESPGSGDDTSPARWRRFRCELSIRGEGDLCPISAPCTLVEVKVATL